MEEIKRDFSSDRVILHVDMNNFYASVETLYDPSLKDIPMAVGGDKESRHGIVLAKNMLAKSRCSNGRGTVAGKAKVS